MIKKGFSHLSIFLLAALSLLPLSILYLLADVFYLLLYYIFGYRKKVVRENLRNAFPEKTFEEVVSIEKRYYKYLSALIFEILKMVNMSKTEIEKRFVFKNKEQIESYFKRGQSVLVCSAHYGNWETAEFEITEMHTRFLEDIIKSEPAYWLWSHRRWKYKPDKIVTKVKKDVNRDKPLV